MPTQTRSSYPSFPTVSPQRCPPIPPCGCSDSNSPETWNYGFNRLVPFPASPPVGAGILAITIFFLIVFFSNILLDQVSFATLGIVVTLGTSGLLALLILILFLV